MWAVVGIGLATVGVHIWVSAGRAAKTGRLSTLIVLQFRLMEYAREHGKYPDKLVDVLDEPSFRAHARIDDIEYVASGKRYQPAPDELIFYEKTPSRYGLSRGCFEVHQQGWRFSQGPPNGPKE
jgi:hypothetical protein